MVNKKTSIEKLVISGVLTALVVVLQVMGQFIRFGPFAISLVLIPIVIGAAVCGNAKDRAGNNQSADNYRRAKRAEGGSERKSPYSAVSYGSLLDGELVINVGGYRYERACKALMNGKRSFSTCLCCGMLLGVCLHKHIIAEGAAASVNANGKCIFKAIIESIVRILYRRHCF